ncbi:MAG: sulfotransferase [Pseudomonadota bacterium]
MSSSVPTSLYLKTRSVMATRRLWLALARLETAVLGDELAAIELEAPIYVTGLARAGTTIVTEMLAQVAGVTSHQYADFPFIFTPYWRNWLAQRSQVGTPVTVERAHQDRIRVSVNSPEAFEEVLWMAFDRPLHHERTATPLAAAAAPAGFDRLYRDHVKKLLAVRGVRRYLAKGNYNLLRLRWLTEHVDNPRFIIMIRHPRWHVASLMKQHALFLKAQEADDRTGRQLAASGHFEFGPLRRATGFAGEDGAREVESLWAAGENVRAWARLWAQAYTVLAEAIADPQLRPHLYCLQYEELCERPESSIDQIAAHALLEDIADVRNRYAEKLSAPTYYEPEFTFAERDALEEETAPVAAKFGYGPL